MVDIANDDEAVAALPKVAWGSVPPPEFCKMLSQCDRVGIGMDVVMNVLRSRLYESVFEKMDS